MEVEKHEGRIQRQVLIGMITSKEVLARIAPKWPTGLNEGLFESKWCNIVGRWCVKHWLKYSRPPGKAIQQRFDRWAPTAEKETVKLVSRFLQSLSDEYKQNGEQNHDFIVDLAADHFNIAAAEKLNREVSKEIERGKVRQALSKINTFVPIDLGSTGTIDVLFDKEAIRKIFADKRESIIKYPGALGRFFGNALIRGAFISFVGPEKSGKSYYLLDMAWMGMVQRLNVAMFVIGDMSQDDVMVRFMERACKRPFKATREDDPVKFPLTIERADGELHAITTTKERHYDEDMDYGDAMSAVDKVIHNEVKSKQPKLKLKCFPGGTINVHGIKSEIDGWVRGGWLPDVVVVDYADNLAPIDGRIDTRHQINATWQALRAIPQTYHALTVTATQANAKSYNAYLLGPDNFSESKMKNAHVTGMIGINQIEDEREMDITRLNWIENRTERASRKRCVSVAGCRAIANIAIRSTW